MKKIVGWALSILVGFAIYLVYWQSQILRVGSWVITPSDIRQRQALIQLQFPGSDPTLAVKQLETSAKYLLIMERNGRSITDEEVRAEAARVEKNTQDPEMLKKIKNIFGTDHEAYLKNVIKPSLVDRVIYYDFFLVRPEIHTEANEKVMKLIDQAQQKGFNFLTEAEKLGLEVKQIVVSPAGEVRSKAGHEDSGQSKLIDQSPQPNAQVYERVRRERLGNRSNPLAQTLSRLASQEIQPGQVFKQPISHSQSLVVAQLVRKLPNGDLQFRLASAPKKNFDQWIEEQEKQLKL